MERGRTVGSCGGLNVYIGAGDEGYLPRGLSNQVIFNRMGGENYENSIDRFALTRNT